MTAPFTLLGERTACPHCRGEGRVRHQPRSPVRVRCPYCGGRATVTIEDAEVYLRAPTWRPST